MHFYLLLFRTGTMAAAAAESQEGGLRQGNKLDVGSVRPYGEGTGNRRLFSGRVKRLQVVCKSVLYWPANPGTGALPGCRGKENRHGKRRSSELAMSDGGNGGGEAGPREAGRGGNDSINLFHAFPPPPPLFTLYYIHIDGRMGIREAHILRREGKTRLRACLA